MKNKIIEILKTICNKTKVDFEKSQLIEDGILDSLAIMNLVCALEEEFDVEFDVDDIDPDNFNKLESIVRLVETYVSKK